MGQINAAVDVHCNKNVWFNQPGIYGEAEVAPYGVRSRPATAMQRRRLSAQTEYLFFTPFLPLALCPQMPDALAEFAYAKSLSIDLTYWELDYQLIPSLSKKDVRTDRIFGIPMKYGLQFLDFATGMLLEDLKTKLVVRLLIDPVRIIEPTISRSTVAEKLLAQQCTFYSFGVQSPTCAYQLGPAVNRATCNVIRDRAGGDPKLWNVMNKFWNHEARPLG